MGSEYRRPGFDSHLHVESRIIVWVLLTMLNVTEQPPTAAHRLRIYPPIGRIRQTGHYRHWPARTPPWPLPSSKMRALSCNLRRRCRTPRRTAYIRCCLRRMSEHPVSWSVIIDWRFPHKNCNHEATSRMTASAIARPRLSHAWYHRHKALFSSETGLGVPVVALRKSPAPHNLHALAPAAVPQPHARNARTAIPACAE